MNRSKALDIKAKFGDNAFYLAMDILEKERIIDFHKSNIFQAENHIKTNKLKISIYRKKLNKLIKEL